MTGPDDAARPGPRVRAAGQLDAVRTPQSPGQRRADLLSLPDPDCGRSAKLCCRPTAVAGDFRRHDRADHLPAGDPLLLGRAGGCAARLGEAFKLTLVASALNVFVPAKAGDLIKSYFVATRSDTSTGVAPSSSTSGCAISSA